MEGISDIKIIGIDERRPPRIRKEPYINLFFRLSHKAPKDWCLEFNRLLANHYYKPKIESDEGLYIEPWVRKPDEIEGILKFLKAKVVACIEQYVRKVEARERATAAGAGTQGEASAEQRNLNEIVTMLDYRLIRTTIPPRRALSTPIDRADSSSPP